MQDQPKTEQCTAKKWMPFNVNHMVRIKLTGIGRAIFRHKHQEYLKRHPSITPSGDGVPEEDADGWSEHQMWALMQDLGPHVCIGFDVPFETEIQIPVTAAEGDAMGEIIEASRKLSTLILCREPANAKLIKALSQLKDTPDDAA